MDEKGQMHFCLVLMVKINKRHTDQLRHSVNLHLLVTYYWLKVAICRITLAKLQEVMPLNVAI